MYYTKIAQEFGTEYMGKKALTVRAIYGLKSADADFRNHLRDYMRYIGHESCPVDPDAWIQPATR